VIRGRVPALLDVRLWRRPEEISEQSRLPNLGE